MKQTDLQNAHNFFFTESLSQVLGWYESIPQVPNTGSWASCIKIFFIYLQSCIFNFGCWGAFSNVYVF